jgi:hypothetical protein
VQVSSNSLAPIAALPLSRLADPRSVIRQWWIALLWTVSLSAATAACLGPLWNRQPAVAVGTLLMTAILIGTGVVLWGEPNHRWTAVLLLASGLLFACGWLEEWGGGPLPLLSELATPIALVLAASAMFRYPDPGLIGRWDRIFLGVLAGWMIGAQFAYDVTSRPQWSRYPESSWWLPLHPDFALSRNIDKLIPLGALVLAGLFVLRWVMRFRQVSGLDRRLLAPIAIVAPLAAAAGVIEPIVDLLNVTGPAFDGLVALEPVLVAAVPVSFLVSVVRRRLANTAVLTLVRQVQQRPTPEAVQQSLRAALDDPSLRVSYWAAQLHAYVGVAGAPVKYLTG